ncbi:MAG: hypothetical protein KZQ69_04905 [gamma proteobacterium symbiont of Bathyaustriella thionipta]|nr:hypothetical protein [gamma proteobacterium symbiont of Bathyaustriella thionipta]
MTTGWTPATRVDHLEVQGTCSSCHNGSTAPGKNALILPQVMTVTPVM